MTHQSDDSIGVDPAGREAPEQDKDYQPDSVLSVACFLQSQARLRGNGQFRAYALNKTKKHPSTRKSTRDTGKDAWFAANAPLNCIAHRSYTWSDLDERIWDDAEFHRRVHTVDGHQYQHPDTTPLLTIQVVFTPARTTAAVWNIVIHEKIESEIIVIVDLSAQRPIICGWSDDIRSEIPSHEDLINGVKTQHGNFTYRASAEFIGSALFFKQVKETAGQGAQVVLDESRRLRIYNEAQQEFYNKCLCNTWQELSDRIFKMLAEKDRPRTLGKSFRQKFLMEQKYNDRVEPTEFAAVFQEVHDERSALSEEEHEDVGSKGKNPKAKKAVKKARSKKVVAEPAKRESMGTATVEESTIKRATRASRRTAAALTRSKLPDTYEDVLPFAIDDGEDDDQIHLPITTVSDDDYVPG